MVIKTAHVTCATMQAVACISTQIFGNNFGTVSDPIPFVFVNADATNTIYLGGSGVTTSNGLPLTAGQSIPMEFIVGEALTLYAIASAGAPVLAILAGRQ